MNIIYKVKIKSDLRNHHEKKNTKQPAKIHLNSVMDTIRSYLIMKNIGQIQGFQRNTGDLKNSKQNPNYNFTF